MLYAIRINTNNTVAGNRWGMIRNKAKAKRIAKRENAEVWAHEDVTEVGAWDWPTFRIGATRIH